MWEGLVSELKSSTVGGQLVAMIIKMLYEKVRNFASIAGRFRKPVKADTDANTVQALCKYYYRSTGTETGANCSC
jgi:hypothetical protein